MDTSADHEQLAREELRFVESMGEYRKKRGWSQADLAKRLQAQGWSYMNQMTISRIENGERPVRFGEARAVAAILGVGVERMVLPDDVGKLLDDLWRAIESYRAARTRVYEAVESFYGEKLVLQATLHELDMRVDLEGISNKDLRARVSDHWNEAKMLSMEKLQSIVSVAEAALFEDDSAPEEENDGERPEAT